MVSFRPLCRSVSLAPRVALFPTGSGAGYRPVRSPMRGRAGTSASGREPRLQPFSSTSPLTAAREKVKVLCVLYDGGERAVAVSSPAPSPSS